jgi:hypothetical protein
MNAILVKETRQSLKSRQFVVTFMLLLAASWFVAVFGMLLAGDDIEFGAGGRILFSVFYFVLSVATLIIIPFGAFRSLQSERDLNTFELLNITTLSPRQIVWGKLLSSLVQLFIFYSAITPFIAVSSLLPGFDSPTAAFFLIGSMLASLLLSMTALMLSSLVKNKASQGFFWFIVLVIGILMMNINFAMFIAIQEGEMSLSDPTFWWATGFFLLACASYFVLFQQITTAQLTFESDNLSSGIRMTCAAQFWLLWICYHVYYKAYPDKDVLWFMAMLSVIHWSVAGLFFTTEEDSLSRRIRRDLPKNQLVRWIVIPFLPGGSRGFLLVLMNLLAVWLLVTGTLTVMEAGESGQSIIDSLLKVISFKVHYLNRVVLVTTGMCFYAVVFLGIATALGRWGRTISSEIRAVHVRVITFLILMAGSLFSFLPRMLDIIKTSGFSYLDLTNPIITLDALFSGGAPEREVLFLLLVAATVSLLVNLRAMYTGATDILNRDVKMTPVQ